MSREPHDVGVPAAPELDRDPETARVHARVIAGLFGDDTARPRIGRYAVRRKLGQGAMGVVYEGFDEVLVRRVAIKLVRTELDAPHVRVRLVREGQALARVNHPGVVHVYEVGEDDGRVFVAMELVEGATLHEWSKRRRRSWQQVLTTCIAAGRGLAAVHAQGLAHRDFKPDNVMVGDDGRVRVTDFGLARFVTGAHSGAPVELGANASAGSTEVTSPGRLVGTPAYMAPEQRQGAAADARADQFAFCVTLWEALHGDRPFEDTRRCDRVRRPVRLVPTWLHAALIRGLCPDRDLRWPSMTALLDVLERGHVRARRRTGVLGVSALAIAVGALGLGHAIDRTRRERACRQEGESIAQVSRRADASDPDIAVGELERSVDAWAQARSEACRRAEIEGAWDARTLDRARWCLDEIQGAIAAAARSSIVPPPGLEHDISRCLDPAALAVRSVPAPEHRDLARDLAAALWSARLGGSTDPDALARLAVRADAIAFAPQRADARRQRAALLARAGQLQSAEILAAEAYFLAAHADAWTEAAAAAELLRDIVGRTSGREVEAALWRRHAANAATLAGS